jgi:hypothetical protein
MAQDKRDILLIAEIGDPVPGEDAFYGHDNVLTIWRDSLQKDVGICFDVPVQDDLPLLGQDAKIHGLGVQIDSAGKFVLLGVKSHLRPPMGKGFGSLNHTCFGYASGGP